MTGPNVATNGKDAKVLEVNCEDHDSVVLTVALQDSQDFRRLDHFLAHHCPYLSRTFIKRLFENGDIYLIAKDSPSSNFENSANKLSLSKLPRPGQNICLNIPPPIPSEAQAEDIPLDILFEDEDLLFINKPPGLVTHPAPGNLTGTLVNALLYHCPDLKGIGGVKRPGIVHRLDKGTSGVMVMAKSAKCHEELVILFSKHQIERYYEALLWGRPMQTQGKLESLIGRDMHNRLKMSTRTSHGKKSLTFYKVLKFYPDFNLTHCEFKLETGRTHQIRVHASSLMKAPIFMDPLYGRPKEQMKRIPENLLEMVKDYSHPFLHAKTLGLVHPMTGKFLKFTVPPPPTFSQVMNLLEYRP